MCDPFQADTQYGLNPDALNRSESGHLTNPPLATSAFHHQSVPLLVDGTNGRRQDDGVSRKRLFVRKVKEALRGKESGGRREDLPGKTGQPFADVVPKITRWDVGVVVSGWCRMPGSTGMLACPGDGCDRLTTEQFGMQVTALILFGLGDLDRDPVGVSPGRLRRFGSRGRFPHSMLQT
jgi:hypothetical protein